MGRSWARQNGAKKNYCFSTRISTCYRAFLYNPKDDPNIDPAIRVATDEINRILSELQQNDHERDRRLAFLAVPDGEEDILRLDWVYEDDEIITASDGNY
jgi:hypothetical protein